MAEQSRFHRHENWPGQTTSPRFSRPPHKKRKPKIPPQPPKPCIITDRAGMCYDITEIPDRPGKFMLEPTGQPFDPLYFFMFESHVQARKAIAHTIEYRVANKIESAKGDFVIVDMGLRP